MKLWVKVFKFLYPPKKVNENIQTLADILCDPSQKEYLMGVKREPHLTPDQHESRMKGDIHHILKHSMGEDYLVWAKEVWTEYINMSEKLMDPRTDAKMVEFLRGGMSMALNLLSLSYKVRSVREQTNETKKQEKKETVLRQV